MRSDIQLLLLLLLLFFSAPSPRRQHYFSSFFLCTLLLLRSPFFTEAAPHLCPANHAWHKTWAQGDAIWRHFTALSKFLAVSYLPADCRTLPVYKDHFPTYCREIFLGGSSGCGGRGSIKGGKKCLRLSVCTSSLSSFIASGVFPKGDGGGGGGGGGDSAFAC